MLTGAVVWGLASPKNTPEPEPLVAHQAARAPDALAQTEASTPAAEAATAPVNPEPEKVQVAIAVAPVDAHVFDGDKDLGKNPVMLEVGETPIELMVKMSGYESQKLTVDGKEKVISVSLKKMSQKSTPTSPRPTPNAAPRPKPKLGDDGLVNPWE